MASLSSAVFQLFLLILRILKSHLLSLQYSMKGHKSRNSYLLILILVFTLLILQKSSQHSCLSCFCRNIFSKCRLVKILYRMEVCVWCYKTAVLFLSKGILSHCLSNVWKFNWLCNFPNIGTNSLFNFSHFSWCVLVISLWF